MRDNTVTFEINTDSAGTRRKVCINWVSVI